MGRPSFPDKAMLFTSMLYQGKTSVEQAISILKDRFGKILFMSDTMPFNYTDYYCREMGSPLFRSLLAFSDLVERESLPEIKLDTNEMEKAFVDNGNRAINIDPGLITLENISLATTKPYSHRIYLRKGIWAEITLIYRGNSYQKLDWTYPDYGSDELITLFNSIRDLYRGRLRCHQA